MSSRARFKCQYIAETKYAGAKSHTIVLTPITPYNSSDTQDNKEFWEATPSGEIKLNVVNEVAVKNFEPGKDYYVDFTPID